MAVPVADMRSPRRARVLVVEEDPRHGEALSRVLDAAGFQVAVVRSAALALRCMRDEQVAVVVLSNSVRGIAVTTAMVARLRTRPEPQLRDAGVVAIVDDQVDAAFGLGEDADVVLVRPVDAERLVDAVTEVASTDADARSARRTSTDGSFFRYRMRLATG